MHQEVEGTQVYVHLEHVKINMLRDGTKGVMISRQDSIQLRFQVVKKN